MPVPGRKIFLKISAAGLFISLADMLPDVSGSAECIKVFHDEQSIKNDGAGYERQLFGEFQKLRDKKNGRDFVWQKRKSPGMSRDLCENISSSGENSRLYTSPENSRTGCASPAQWMNGLFLLDSAWLNDSVLRSEAVHGRHRKPVLVRLSVGAVTEVVHILQDAVGLFGEVPAYDAGKLVYGAATAALCQLVFEISPVCAESECAAGRCVAGIGIEAVASEAAGGGSVAEAFG